MTFITLCLTPERWMGSMVQSTVSCFSELCFLQFSVAQVLLGLQKQFINNLVFPTWACAARFNNDDNNNNNNNIILSRSTESFFHKLITDRAHKYLPALLKILC